MSGHVMRQGWRTQSPAKDRLGPQHPEGAEWAPLPGALRGSVTPRRPAFLTSSFQNWEKDLVLFKLPGSG